jgi:sugar (pentulose or hexulose) kinase
VQPTITVDIGTTSVKLCFFAGDGTLLTSDRHATPTRQDAHGEVYDTDALRALVTDFVHGLESARRAEIRRISITGVGESGGLVRPDGSLASPMILWHDHRGAAYLDHLTDGQRSRIYRITGLPVNGNYAISKTAWAVDRADDPEGAVWLNVAEHLATTLTGQRFAEPSLASRTMALDLGSGDWSEEVCAMFGLDTSTFPPLRPARDGVPLAPDAAASTGLPEDVQVHVAGHDHMVGAIGAGLQPGELLNSTGTTEGLLLLAEKPRLEVDAEHAKLANGLACAGEDRTVFASIPTGGSAFATLQRMLGTDADALGTMIASLHERYLADELDLDRAPIVLPRFRGSPPPTKDRSARGLIAGIGDDTTDEDIVLGCFLGLVLQFSDVLDLFAMPARQIKVIGPASSNPLWLQLKADLLGTPLSAARFPEVVSRGAQALAADVLGSWEETDPVDVLPDAARHERLLRWSADVRHVWNHLQGTPA